MVCYIAHSNSRSVIDKFKFITETRGRELIELIGRWYEADNYKQYNTSCPFYFYSNYDQTSGNNLWKKNVHGNGLMLLCSSHVAVLIFDISIPLMTVKREKYKVILEYATFVPLIICISKYYFCYYSPFMSYRTRFSQVFSLEQPCKTKTVKLTKVSIINRP